MLVDYKTEAVISIHHAVVGLLRERPKFREECEVEQRKLIAAFQLADAEARAHCVYEFPVQPSKP